MLGPSGPQSVPDQIPDLAGWNYSILKPTKGLLLKTPWWKRHLPDLQLWPKAMLGEMVVEEGMEDGTLMGERALSSLGRLERVSLNPFIQRLQSPRTRQGPRV